MRKWIDYFEEAVLALLLSAMTIITFSQVVARYLFNSGAVWALELTTFLFAWLVLFGASYCVKKGVHIGIDAFVMLFPEKIRRLLTLLAISCCILFAGLLFKGSWDYLETLHMIGLEVEDMPIEEWKVKIILPIAFVLITFRLLEVAYHVIKGDVSTLHFVNENKKITEMELH